MRGEIQKAADNSSRYCSTRTQGGEGRAGAAVRLALPSPFLRPLRGTLALAAVVAAGEKQWVFPGHLSASVIPVHCSPASPGGATIG